MTNYRGRGRPVRTSIDKAHADQLDELLAVEAGMHIDSVDLGTEVSEAHAHVRAAIESLLKALGQDSGQLPWRLRKGK